MALRIEVSGWDRKFQPVELAEVPESVLEELLELTTELPEGCVTLQGNRYRWRPE